ncbi:hypothetical protein [Streptomyces sp. NPDC093598]|uniref:hypothetical protein n=1 Tax=Streptomyces sp. NPDC093598 TaxID=3366046 RepID=UPI00380D1C00
MTGTAGMAGVVAMRGDDTQHASGSADVPVRTVAVVRTDLSNSMTLSGELGYGPVRQIKGTAGGLVTWLPDVGATVKRGGTLYRVDDRPAVVFFGETPLFRSLDTPGLVGPDIRTVADNLEALGYDIGRQPSVGTVVRQPAASPPPPEQPQPSGSGTAADAASPSGAAARRSSDPPKSAPPGPGSSTPASQRVEEGDAVLTDALIAVVKRWQASANLPATGVLGPGDVVVTTSAVRVSAVQAQTGDEAAGNLLSVTATRKVVTVPVDARDIGAITRGARVRVTLPDQSSAQGEVTQISSVVTNPQGGESDGTARRMDVTIEVDDAGTVRRLSSSTVQVEFTGRVRKNVLAVPVSALLALAEGGYGLQRPGGSLVAVRTGLLARGMAEISGPGVREGMKVVATS